MMDLFDNYSMCFASTWRSLLKVSRAKAVLVGKNKKVLAYLRGFHEYGGKTCR